MSYTGEADEMLYKQQDRERCRCNTARQNPDCHIDHTLSILEAGIAFPQRGQESNPMKARCGQEDCDCGHTIEALEACLDCGKDSDCASLVETQEQCQKHYILYVAREFAEAHADKAEYAGALDRLQQRFNEVWTQHQRMLLALENARDVIHRTQCPGSPSLPRQCWKECEEAMDAMLEAGWMPLEATRYD